MERADDGTGSMTCDTRRMRDDVMMTMATKLTGRTESGSGRPRATSRREIELVALDLFTRQGFESTTVEEIAEQAGVSKRTFFRYFNAKADVLWAEFDQEVDALRRLLAEAPADEPVTSCVRTAVLAANHYGVQDVDELRNRMQVITANPLAQAGASQHYDAWAGAVADFAATRLHLPNDDLLPRAIGFSALAVCRAAFDQWIKREDADLIAYLDEALSAWRSGFAA